MVLAKEKSEILFPPHLTMPEGCGLIRALYGMGG
jgi:hypothetical protein